MPGWKTHPAWQVPSRKATPQRVQCRGLAQARARSSRNCKRHARLATASGPASRNGSARKRLSHTGMPRRKPCLAFTGEAVRRLRQDAETDPFPKPLPKVEAIVCRGSFQSLVDHFPKPALKVEAMACRGSAQSLADHFPKALPKVEAMATDGAAGEESEKPHDHVRLKSGGMRVALCVESGLPNFMVDPSSHVRPGEDVLVLIDCNGAGRHAFCETERGGGRPLDSYLTLGLNGDRQPLLPGASTSDAPNGSGATRKSGHDSCFCSAGSKNQDPLGGLSRAGCRMPPLPNWRRRS